MIDGGFSNDSPCLDSYTITVSALHREADIKPLDYSYITNTASASGSKNGTLKDDVSADTTVAADMLLDVENSAAYKYKIRITSLDIVRVPKYERVWEVAGMGLVSTLIYTLNSFMCCYLSSYLSITMTWINAIDHHRNLLRSVWTSRDMNGNPFVGGMLSRLRYDEMHYFNTSLQHYLEVEALVPF